MKLYICCASLIARFDLCSQEKKRASAAGSEKRAGFQVSRAGEACATKDNTVTAIQPVGASCGAVVSQSNGNSAYVQKDETDNDFNPAQEPELKKFKSDVDVL